MQTTADTQSQLVPIIQSFFAMNPSPADAQIHALAGALGVDKETLEAVIYQLYGQQNNGGQAAEPAPEAQPQAEPQVPNHAATMSERILQDNIDPEVAPTNQISINDGWGSAAKDQMIQDITFADGAPVTRSAE